MNSTQLGHEIGRILAMVASDDLTLNQAADEAQSAIDEFEKGANEAIAPLQAKIDEQGRGLIDAAHRLALAQSELTTLRADKERLDWLEKYTLFEVRLGYDGIPMISMGRPTMETPPLRYQLDQAIDSAIQNEKG